MSGLMAIPNHIDHELVRKFVTHVPLLPAARLDRWYTPPTPYKLVEEFHFDHCGCDECGVYRRVGIG